MLSMDTLEWLSSESDLEDFLSTPESETVDFLCNLPAGDFAILGIGGKMGPTLGMMLVKAIALSGIPRRVFGISRFSDETLRNHLSASGIEVVPCDLSISSDVMALPDAKYIIFMAGRKFGSTGSEALTWIMNVAVPYNVINRYQGSQIVAFSTGCVYPLSNPSTGGSSESVFSAPVGEYSNSCLGRERIFEYATQMNTDTKVLLYRLNYAIDTRYGVLSDIASNILSNRPVDLTVSHFNCIWQGEANNRAIRCIGLSSSPATPLNITGVQTHSVREAALKMGKLLGKEVTFSGTPGKTMYLANACKAAELLGTPRISLDTMIEWQVEWLKRGGMSLNKPTHFTVTDGQFLD